eukprot:11853223-Alexandrium_andersonii.AAC.1
MEARVGALAGASRNGCPCEELRSVPSRGSKQAHVRAKRANHGNARTAKCAMEARALGVLTGGPQDGCPCDELR